MAQQWEYRLISTMTTKDFKMDRQGGSELAQFHAFFTAQLAELGAHGWEAVGSLSVSDAGGRAWPQLLFKRPKG
jgi:hypothetical protein